MCSKCDRQRKLSELAALITGASYGISFVSEKKTNVKDASSIEKSQKFKELGKLIKG